MGTDFDAGMVLTAVVDAARRAGAQMLAEFDDTARPPDRAAMYAAGSRIEDAAESVLRAALGGLVPGVGWYDEDTHGGRVPDGRWWIVDGAEGGVNFVHGLPEWAVTATLVEDAVPWLTVVRQPIGERTWTAIRGSGAYLDGRRLRVSVKTDLGAAVVTTSQAGNDPAVHAAFGAVFAALSDAALLVRNTIPTTFPLLGVADGHYDAFVQYEPDLPGCAAGTLIACEAGATVTDLAGRPWRLGEPEVLVATPGVHAELLAVLAAAAVAS